MDFHNERASRQASSFFSKDKVACAGLVEGRRCIGMFSEGKTSLKTVSALEPLKIIFFIDECVFKNDSKLLIIIVLLSMF